MTKPRILIVEDEPFVARDIQQQLVKVGYEPVAHTPLASEAISLAEQLRPDLVLMDIHLEEELDGIAAAQIIHDRLDLPVVLLMTSAAEETLDLAKKSEPFGTIIKPFGEQELRAAIEMTLYKHQTEALLRQVREEQSAILHAALDGFWLLDLQGRVLDVNEACCRMHGYMRDEMLGKSLTSFVADETSSEIAAGLEKIKQVGSAKLEGRHRCKDGHLIDVEMSITYLPGDSGRFSSFLRDITEHKQMEVALRRSEERATKAFLTIPDGIVISRLADSLVLEVNDSFCRLSGLSREEVIGHTMPELDLWDQQSERNAFLKSLREQGRVEGMEAGFHNKSGGHRIIALSAEVMDQDQEKLVLIIAHDITERKRTEAALRENEDLYHDLVDNSHELVTTYDLDGNLLSVNETAIRNTGYPREALLKMNLVDLIVPKMRYTLPVFLSSIRAQGKGHGVMRIQTASGETRFWEYDATVRTEGVAMPIVRGMALDITERRQAEAKAAANEENLRTVIENSHAAIFLKDGDGRWLIANRKGLEVFDLASLDWTGRTNAELAQLRPGLAPAFNDCIASDEMAWAAQKPVVMEEIIPTTNGSIVLSMGKVPLFYPDGRRRGLVVVGEDITESKRVEAALRENEDRYRDLVDNSLELISTYDMEGNFLTVNETVVRITGYPHAALLKMNLADLAAPGTRHLFPEYLKTLRTFGKADGIMQIQTANGEKRFWEYNTTVRTEGVATPIVRGMGLDITERRRAEKALRASESQLQVILESTDDGILAVDHKGKVLKTNNRFAELWKIPPSIIASGDDDALLKHVLAQLNDPDAFLGKVQSLYASDATELDLLHFKDGRCFERYSSPMYEGTFNTGRVWSFRDITDRKRSEEALRENEDRYRDLIENSHELIATYDLEGNFISVNETAVRATGYPRETLLKMNMADLVSPQTRHLFPEYLNTLRRLGKAHGVVRIQNANGETSFWEFDGTVRTQGVAAPIVRGMALDITERLRSEKALRASKEMEEELLRREAMARAASEAKSTFLAAMSHELRTPLIGVTGMLEVLTHGGLDAKQRQVVDIIQESSENLLQIIGDILDFSKIEANKLELAPQTFSARALMESVSHIFSSALSAKGLKFVVKVDPRVAAAYVADAMRIRQILNNFMSNAVKFTERGSITLRLVRLESHSGHDSLAFEVQDTGIGVSSESQAKLFEPFSQAEASTTRRFGGTGLGLVISQRLAVLMGGNLAMQSALGQGTTLTLTVDLPIGDERDIAKPTVPDASKAVPTRPAPSIEEAMQEHSLVLMAEDHPTNRTVLTQQVNRAGYALEVAVDGQEAFEKWQSGRFALLLTDLHMPRMDGYQLTKAVRDWERAHGSPRIPILALTANALGGEAERCLELGMDDYLIKPVTIPLLAFKLHQWMPHVKLGEVPEALATPPPKTVEWITSVDSKTLLDLCGGDAASAQEILNDFIATTRADLLVMQNALRQQDRPCIVRQSHRIKGSSAMIGLLDMTERAKKLEAYAKTDTAEWKMIQEQLEGIQEALKAVDRAE